MSSAGGRRGSRISRRMLPRGRLTTAAAAAAALGRVLAHHESRALGLSFASGRRLWCLPLLQGCPSSRRFSHAGGEEATAGGGSEAPRSTLPRRRIFSGIQPTGVLHLGNYFGAVRRWVELQEAGEDVVFCVVDLHSITLPQDPATLHSQILRMAASLLACGIEPERAVLFQQSRVVEHALLNWVLGCLATLARLGHLPQYKEKSAALKEVPLGLYVYPVLQAADILLYRATHVPVGEDQLQHIQLAAHLARVFNNRYGFTFRLPHSIVCDDARGRLRSLRQPAFKMSKSEADPRSRIELTDSPDEIREKLKKAVTDCTSEVYFDAEGRPGVSNLMTIHSAITGLSHEDIRAQFAGKDTGQYKLLVADVVIEHLRPIREELVRLLDDRAHLDHILDQGAARARDIASHTWAEVARKVGLTE